ncbi:hypothetical protein AAG906_008874 [Vitis piasezkii]
MLDSKPATTLGLLGQMFSHLDGEPLSDATLYRSIVGALQYLTLTRPDISFAFNKKKHWWLWHIPRSEFSVMVLQQTKDCEICLSSSFPPLLWCDNKSAAHLAANLLDLHFIRDRVLRKLLIIQYIPSFE